MSSQVTRLLVAVLRVVARSALDLNVPASGPVTRQSVDQPQLDPLPALNLSSFLVLVYKKRLNTLVC